jgi:HK97 family phage prohead protease
VRHGAERVTDVDTARKRMLIALAGPLMGCESLDEVPAWPLETHRSTDEANVSALSGYLGLDERGYRDLFLEALDLALTDEFRLLHTAVTGCLDYVPRIGPGAPRGAADDRDQQPRGFMDHLTVKAATTATDQGSFRAVAAAWTIDRDNDQIVPGAFSKTIARWRASGKLLPLHYNHDAAADHIIGYVRPDTMAETDEGLIVEGQLDLDESDLARAAWRSMKRGVMSLSFGYLATDTFKRSDGIQELREIDLFEVSIVPAPANADTRILSLKGAADDNYDAIRAQARDEVYRLLTMDPEPTDEPESTPPDGETLRKEFDALGIDTKSRPAVQVSVFEC